jgi:hypothetical protein
MFRAFMAVYPWDVTREDECRVLDCVQGQIGLNGVSLWAVTPPLMHLRAPGREPRLFRTTGGMFFPAKESLYSVSRLKPAVAQWAKGKDPLRHTAEACAERSMALNVLISATRVGDWARRHPELAAKNVLGVPSECALCPSNPDVSAFLAALLGDISENPAVFTCILADLQCSWPEAFQSEFAFPGRGSARIRDALSICFCESCLQAAEGARINVEAARESVRRSLDLLWDRAELSEAASDPDVSVDAEASEYLQWQARATAELAKRLAGACRELWLYRGPTLTPASRAFEACGTVPCGLVLEPRFPGEIREPPLPAANRKALALSESFLIDTHPAQVVKTVVDSCRCGVEFVQFNGFGLLPEYALDGVRQAVRFARRTASH